MCGPPMAAPMPAVTSHDEVSCRSAPGVGASLSVQLSGIGERGCSLATCRASAVATDAAAQVSYVRPRVFEVLTADQHSASTRGGDAVTLSGEHFGAVGSVPRVEYAVPTSDRPTSWEGAALLVAVRCEVVNFGKIDEELLKKFKLLPK